MHKKIALFFFAAAIIALPFCAFADTNTSSTTNLSPTPPGTPALTTAQIPPLLEHIINAKQQLQAVNLNYTIVPLIKTVKQKGKPAKKVQTGYMLSHKDAALAIWDPNSSQIVIATGSLTGKIFDFSASPGIEVRQHAFNGVDTGFDVSQPPGGIVLALKYLLSNPDSGSQAAIIAGLQPTIYVPYSPSLSTPEMAVAGAAYLDSVMNTVVFQLNQIESVSAPGMKLTDAIQPAIIKALIYSEHTNNADFAPSANVQDAINRLNILFAIDGGDTFKYSVSSGGARGIAQFIPSTYLGVVQRHPYANLISDPTIGLSDQVNSIKAEYLLIDDYIQAVHARIADSFNPVYSDDYGAASYNGGVTRVVKAVQTFGDSWNIDPATESANLQTQINGENAAIQTVKNQLKQTADPTQKAALNAQLNNENSTLADLKAKLKAVKTTALHAETVGYLNKMHQLIQAFNVPVVAAASAQGISTN